MRHFSAILSNRGLSGIKKPPDCHFRRSLWSLWQMLLESGPFTLYVLALGVAGRAVVDFVHIASVCLEDLHASLESVPAVSDNVDESVSSAGNVMNSVRGCCHLYGIRHVRAVSVVSLCALEQSRSHISLNVRIVCRGMLGRNQLGLQDTGVFLRQRRLWHRVR